MRTHFGFNDETKTTEEIRIDVEEDPLENPLADSESDPLNSSLTEGEKNATANRCQGESLEQQKERRQKDQLLLLKNVQVKIHK